MEKRKFIVNLAITLKEIAENMYVEKFKSLLAAETEGVIFIDSIS